MSHRKLLWSALGLSATLALGGNALAQTPGSGAMPPDTTPPDPAAQPMSPSSAKGDADAGGDKPAALTHKKKHARKKAQPQPKAEDNDNNAMPNSTSPAPAPSASPQ